MTRDLIGGKLREMANAEGERNLFQRTIRSEGFEKFSRRRIGIITAILLLGFGVGSVDGIIEAIDKERAAAVASYGIQAGLELGGGGAIAYSNIRSRIRTISNNNGST